MTKITKNQILKMQKKRMTDAAMGKALGVTRQAVHQMRKKMGIKSSASSKSDRNAAIAKAYAAGEPGTAIAQKLGLSISQTYRIINAAKDKSKKAEKKAINKLTMKKGAAAKKKAVKKKKK
jgi:phage terminase small subunit